MVDRATEAKIERFSQADESDGFKFAVALIIAFSTTGNAIYYYVNNNPVINFWCAILNGLFPISLTILCLVLYMITKGVSLEINSPKVKENLEKISASIYIFTFKLFAFYILIEIFDIILKFFVIFLEPDALIIIKVILMLIIFYYIFFCLYVDKSKKSVPYLIFVFVLIAIIVLSGFIFTPYLLAGEIKVEMDDIYTNETHIPVYIVNTGYNGDIIINFNRILTEDNASLDSIKLHADDSNQNTHGDYLYINSLSYGEYKVFIDSTNLTPGYYQLSFSEESQNSRWIPIVERIFPLTHKKYNVFYFGRN